MKRLKSFFFSIATMTILFTGCQTEEPIHAKIARSPQTFCNPLNLDYRFMVINGGDGIREAADPVVVPYKDKYLLFASKSSGYWYSSDFNEWTHVIIPDSVLPIEDYAPAIYVEGDYVYYVGSTHGKGMVYRSNAPEEGRWEAVKEIWSFWDPAFYIEGENLYMYYGCSPVDPIYARVLDLRTMEARSEPMACFNSDQQKYGWERPGEQNELPRRPYIEGAWMTEHNGKYYLQYAGPGTEWKSYADGAYIADSPMGPFKYMEESPVSYKPAGFIGGAGHGCMFQVGKHYWKAATNAICLRHMFERRLSFFPSGFDTDGVLYTDTYLGDYPMFLPATDAKEGAVRPDWMLLSLRKEVMASSALPEYPATNALDEEARTAWVAAGNGKDEWLQVDLGETMSINAIQVNYDEYGATWKGVNDNLYEAYILSASNDGEKWYIVADYTDKRTDTPHDYVEFEEPFRARYIRWENREYTISGNVSLRELRVFGRANGNAPKEATDLEVVRKTEDLCRATLAWKSTEGADGYVVRYGLSADKLYHSFQVPDGASHLEITSLNSKPTYYFTVDAYNASGVTRGMKTVKASGEAIK